MRALLSTPALRSAVACGTSLALVLAQAPIAYAQTNVADALFREGQRLMTAGQTHEACLKFAESQRADPAIGTLINLAACHEKEGKIASAATEFSDAAAEAQRAGQPDREQYARSHAQALDKKVHHLVIDFKSPPDNAEVKLDGTAFGLALLHTPVPVDPGEHTVEAAAPGKKSWSQKITAAADAATDHIDIPELENAPAPPPQETKPTPATGALVAPPPEEPHSNKTKLAVGYIALGVGVVAAGLTGYFAYRFVTYNNRYNDQKHCITDRASNPGACPDQPDNTTISDNRSQAITNQDIMLVSGGVAVVGLGLGAFFLITAGGDTKASALRVTPTFGPHEAGLGATGRF